jgi:hypothetical protein
MMPLTANVAAIPASFFRGCTLGGLAVLLLLLSELVLLLLSVPAAAAAASGPAGCAGPLWIQQPSTIGS